MAVTNVSRETLGRLKAYLVLLKQWNSKHNLVSRKSLDDVWHRHILDSAQLAPLIPDSAKKLIDLGSGAGFPGLVIAAIRPDLEISLCESIAKKCHFLAEVADKMQVKVDIRNRRIEDMRPEGFDVVTARACAPMVELLPYAQRFQAPQTINLFLKGQNIDVELKDTTKYWKMTAEKTPSLSDPNGTILTIRNLLHVRTGGSFVKK